MPPPAWTPVALEPEADAEPASVEIDSSVVSQKEIALTVEVFTEPPTVTDPHGEHVDRVTMAMRGKVDAPFAVGAVHVAPVAVDTVRDVETVVPERTLVSEGTMVVAVEAFNI